jgi:hypothetical protein
MSVLQALSVSVNEISSYFLKYYMAFSFCIYLIHTFLQSNIRFRIAGFEDFVRLAEFF